MRAIELASRTLTLARRGSDVTPGMPLMGGNGIFKGAEVSRLFEDWQASLLSPDDEIRYGSRVLRARAREQARNNSYCRNYLGILQDNVIGWTHPAIRRTTPEIKAAFNRWAHSPFVDRRTSLAAGLRIAIATTARDGEIFIRMHRGFGNPFAFALQFIDADLLDDTYNVRRMANQNEICMGVELDEYRAPVAYHFFDREYSLTSSPTRRYRVPAEEIIHLHISDRPNECRGKTWLTASMANLHMIGAYIVAEIVAARIGASKGGFYVNKGGMDIGGGDSSKKFIESLAPGTNHALPPGWEFTAYDPQHPNANAPEFLNAMLRSVAVGMRIPFHSLSGDLRSVSYSSIRAGTLESRDYYRGLQWWLIESAIRPIFENWIAMADLTGQIRGSISDSVIEDVVWEPRGWEWVDPLKETTAIIDQIDHGLESITGALSQRGRDVDDVIAEREEELKKFKDAGIPLPAPGTPTNSAAVQAAGAEGKDPNADPNADDAASGSDGSAKKDAPQGTITRSLDRTATRAASTAVGGLLARRNGTSDE